MSIYFALNEMGFDVAEHIFTILITMLLTQFLALHTYNR